MSKANRKVSILKIKTPKPLFNCTLVFRHFRFSSASCPCHIVLECILQEANHEKVGHCSDVSNRASAKRADVISFFYISMGIWSYFTIHGWYLLLVLTPLWYTPSPLMSQDSRLRPSCVTGRWTEAGERAVTPMLRLADHLWFRWEIRTWTKL